MCELPPLVHSKGGNKQVRRFYRFLKLAIFRTTPSLVSRYRRVKHTATAVIVYCIGVHPKHRVFGDLNAEEVFMEPFSKPEGIQAVEPPIGKHLVYSMIRL